MSISPVMYRSKGSEGKTLDMPVKVQNFDTRSTAVTLAIHSVRYADGGYGAILDKPTKFDCSEWFPKKVFAVTIPGSSGQVTIPVKCVVPLRTPPGHYYCLATVEQASDPNSPEIRPQYQVPMIILVGNPAKPDLKFGTPTMEVGTKFTSIKVPFINDGDAFVVLGATVTLRNTVTNQVYPIASDSDRNFYPQSKRTLPFSIETGALPDGQYSVQYTAQLNFTTFRPAPTRFVVVKGKATAVEPGKEIALPPFTVDPPMVRQHMPAGSMRISMVKLINQTDHSLTISLTPHPLTELPNGIWQAQENAPLKGLTVECIPPTVTIEAKRTAFVQFKLTTAKETSGEVWFAVSSFDGTGKTMSQEVQGSVAIPNTDKSSMAFGAFQVGKIGDRPNQIDYDITNTGNCARWPYVTASVLERGLTAIRSLEVPQLGNGGILPGITIHNRLLLPLDLKPGAYTVRLEYQYDKIEKTGEAVSVYTNIPFYVPEPKKGKG